VKDHRSTGQVKVHGPELGPTIFDHNFHVLLTRNIASLYAWTLCARRTILQLLLSACPSYAHLRSRIATHAREWMRVVGRPATLSHMLESSTRNLRVSERSQTCHPRLQREQRMGLRRHSALYRDAAIERQARVLAIAARFLSRIVD
jgi:hypothetical protein